MILALKKPRLVVELVVVGEVQFNVLICKNIFYEKHEEIMEGAGGNPR